MDDLSKVQPVLPEGSQREVAGLEEDDEYLESEET